MGRNYDGQNYALSENTWLVFIIVFGVYLALRDSGFDHFLFVIIAVLYSLLLSLVRSPPSLYSVCSMLTFAIWLAKYIIRGDV